MGRVQQRGEHEDVRAASISATQHSGACASAVQHQHRDGGRAGPVVSYIGNFI
jgi:hypothetical protein